MTDKVIRVLRVIYKFYIVLVTYIASILLFGNFYKLVSGVSYNNEGAIIKRELSMARIITALIIIAIYFYVFRYCYKPLYFDNIDTGQKNLFTIVLMFLFILAVIYYRTIYDSAVAFITLLFLMIFNPKGITFKDKAKIKFGYNTFIGSLALMILVMIAVMITVFLTEPVLLPAPDGY